MSTRMDNCYDLIVIGAGASGCMAALTAVRRGKSVLLLEKNDSICKKILATGNGRCNFTNQKMDQSYYHGNADRIATVLNRFGVQSALDFFHSIGISPIERDGYYYPMSNQAKSVVTAFEQAILQSSICLICSCKIESVEKHQNYLISTNHGLFEGRNVLIATGLLNSAMKGIEESLFPVIKGFGHHIKKIVPALCGFYCHGMDFKKIAGVRVHAGITLWVDGKKIANEEGELQICDYGLSGIPVFQLSALAGRALAERKTASFMIDFLPDFEADEAAKELSYRLNHFKKPMNGLLPDKLADLFEKEFQIMDQNNPDLLIKSLKEKQIAIENYRELRYAQTCSGGIEDSELKENSLESALSDGLYFGGELLDVDGICGGYNLHWAWASGYAVGSDIV